MADDPKTPMESALDLFVYAPLGLFLAARDNLPELVERGRRQFTSQVDLARMMGKYAVAEAEKDARKRAKDVAQTVNAFTGSRGESPDRAPVSGTAQAPTSARARPSTAASGSDDAVQTNGKARVPAGPARSSAHLAIPGYDTLSASQVVQRLAGLAADELDAVREYEDATRGRRTILSKITQLQADRPS